MSQQATPGSDAGTGSGAKRDAVEAGMPLPARMLRFVGERFPLQIHGISIAMFFLTNACVGHASTAPGPVPIGPRALLAAFGLGLMFLRLRLFDEVKDYAYDLEHNPTRPLPRGLLSVRETNLWAAGTALLEAGIALYLGWPAVTGFLVVLAFTLLMRFEFFCRALIRPRLFTYALIHTPSGGLIGLFVYCAVTGRVAWDLTRAMALYVLAGWALLMVFELARKTYDEKTEPGPDTYSSVFGTRGAALLNAGFVLASTLLVLMAVSDALTPEAPVLLGYGIWGVTGLALSAILQYWRAPSSASAKGVRIVAQVYLMLASALSAGTIIWQRGMAWSGAA